jgi:hypothetical protein
LISVCRKFSYNNNFVPDVTPLRHAVIQFPIDDRSAARYDESHSLMPTQKSSTQKRSKTRKPQTATAPSIMGGCCSATFDLILHDPACKVELTESAIRISHPNEKFSFVGLPLGSVTKGYKPWRVHLKKGEA